MEKMRFPVTGGINFDEIIDVRSPGEFAEDHITGAVNLPVLNDDQRMQIGTIYKQVSPFEARRMGAAMVSRNIAAHIDAHFFLKEKEYRPLIHCWRGGQRSESMATVLSGIGWHVGLIEGGYRAYRKVVINTIEKQVEALDLVILNGFTGAGKTLVLKQLRSEGEQILDLEGLACHKGSVFGGDPENPQPAQKRFESLLYDELVGFDPARPVFVEAESAKIGKLNLPNPLWQKMKQSKVIELASPLERRADYLASDYRDWLKDIDRILDTIDRLKGFHAESLLMEWKNLARQENWHQLISSLLSQHYDRRYRPETDLGHFHKPSHRVDMTQHTTDSLQRCAAEIRTLVL